MANNVGTLITAEIRPQSDLDTIATAFANEIRGGWHNVSSIVERDAIYDDRKQAGMACYVTDVSAAYVWDGSNWNEFSTTSVSGSAGFTPIAGNGIDITPIGNDYSFAVNDYISKSEVASISGDLQQQIDAITISGSGNYVLKSGDTMTGQLAGISGSASMPSFSFDGDTDTGMFLSDVDTLSFGVNSMEMIRLFPDGGIQIGGPFSVSPGVGNIFASTNIYAQGWLYASSVRLGPGSNGDTSTTALGNLANARSQDTSVGSGAGTSISTGSINNTLVGFYSGGNITSGNLNTCLGANSGFSLSTGTNNVCIGYFAGALATGSNEFYLDSTNRINNTNEKVRALMYGTFGTVPADQTIRANGRLTVNVNTSTTVLSPPSDAVINCTSVNGQVGRINVNAHGTSTGVTYSAQVSRGTSSVPTALQSGDQIVKLEGYGYTGSAYSSSYRGALRISTAENWTSTAQGTILDIDTTAPGTTTTSTKVRVWGDGGVQIGGTFTASMGAGNLQVAGIAGTNGNIVTHDANGKLLDSGVNIASISGDFVNISGDTMTGNLEVPVLKATTQVDIDTSGMLSPEIFFKNGGSTWASIRGNPDELVFKDSSSTDVVTVNTGLTVHPLAGNTDNIVTLDANGKLQASGNTVSDFTLLSTTATISGDLQGQINNKQNNITLVAGSNVSINESPTDTWTISASISGSGGIEYVSAPLTPTDTGTQGQRAYDSNYVYECIAANTWVRYAAASSW